SLTIARPPADQRDETSITSPRSVRACAAASPAETTSAAAAAHPRRTRPVMRRPAYHAVLQAGLPMTERTNDRPVRVRIAPSPTGDPHVGTAYIALFNYVFAR